MSQTIGEKVDLIVSIKDAEILRLSDKVREALIRTKGLEARVKELEDFLEHEEHTYKYHGNWWETRLERWKKNIAAGNDE